MLACVDVAYRKNATIAGCVLFSSWSDDHPAGELLVSGGPAALYRPGEFYLRELPPILNILNQVTVRIETVVVDGYVWLGGDRMGLGAHLHSALGGRVAVVGVAKTRWRGGIDQKAIDPEHRTIAVSRGGSNRPLYITSEGMNVVLAANYVAGMHGAFRIPTLVAMVNTLVQTACRGSS
jgi:deoxyribonuclease V